MSEARAAWLRVIACMVVMVSGCTDGGLGVPAMVSPDLGAPDLARESGTGLRADDYVASYHESYCERMVRCERVDPEAAPRCEASVGAQSAAFYGSMVAPPACSFALGRTRIDEDAAARCLAEQAAIPCDRGDDRPEVCNRVFVGTVDDGAACSLDGECAAPLFCRQGHCAMPSLDLGEDCSDSARVHCKPGLHCAGVCVKISGLGEPCGRERCAAGLLCFRASGEAEGVCREQAGPGEACDQRARAGGLDCDEDVTPHVCVASAKLVPLGSACQIDPTQPIGTRSLCRRYARCLDGVCAPAPAVGEACTWHGDCPDGFCNPVSKVCALLGGPGDTCYPGFDYTCRLDIGCDDATGRCRTPAFLSCGP